jgi:hypothetical protein
MDDPLSVYNMHAGRRRSAIYQSWSVAVKNEEKAKVLKYQPPKIRKVVLENKKALLATCKVEKADSRGLGPCQGDMGAVCKEP